MRYRVDIKTSVSRRINSWNLPDGILVDVHLRLREELPENPTQYLRRAHTPFEGMLYEFSVIDPADRLCEHDFAFRVFYSQDETTLIVTNAGYWRRVGM